ncbi:hypothetical protein HNQ56_002961 [Anaerotaenia torta]|uniref:glycosyl hydrolase 2 galactose-binding domain-containing protein n=1 Tax=Anaerotaenia torta TaxID=433293 RepID=UPI003D1FD2DE
MSGEITKVRNLAYRRAAYQSSSYTVNETAQLVTAGLEPADESKMAYEFLHRDGNQSRYGNVKYLFDYGKDTQFETYTTDTWVQVRLPRRTRLGSYTIKAGSCCGDSCPFPSVWTLYGSGDGVEYHELDRQVNQVFAQHETKTYPVDEAAGYTHYRLSVEEVLSGDRIHMAEWSLQDTEGRRILASYDENVFSYVSAWMSAGNQEEWVYVDLGGDSVIQGVKIYWGSMYATVYEIQVSGDARNWVTVAEDCQGCGGTKEISFFSCSARYVRLYLKETDPGNIAYIVREFQVFGTNDVKYLPESGRKEEEGKQFLNQNSWKLERAERLKLPESPELAGSLGLLLENRDGLPEVPLAGTLLAGEIETGSCSTSDMELGMRIASERYDTSGWLPAVVPGTVFYSYVRAGAVADPCFEDWQRCASDSHFKSDFWYRTSFTVPGNKKGQRVWLNFDGINWKARVFLNGAYVGAVNGGFTRGRFDISSLIRYGEENSLAVLILKNTDPGTAYTSNNDGPGTMGGVFGNDGRIGEDAPTYSAANGWDWVPTVRGRNIGIYNDVYLTYTGAIQVKDPWVVTVFDRKDNGEPDLSRLNMTLKAELANSSDETVTAVLRGRIEELPELVFEQEVVLKAGESVQAVIGPLVLEEPKVWWPNGYGEQPLYHMTVTASAEEEGSDTKHFQFGAREFTYTLTESDETDRNGYKNGNNLAILCNGVRIVIRGGNWGLEDIHLNVDEERYDDKIRLHKYENFNIIRNWGGQTYDEQLYKACDKYGILIWDDFFFPGCWLHSPKEPGMFLENVRDRICRFRSHACIALYCGANEMHPEVEEIEKGIREYVRVRDGVRHYIPNSAKAPVAEDGPHKAMLPEFYFQNTLPDLMNSERGMPNIPVAETMRMIFSEDKLWPHNELWALHDFALRWNVDGGGYLKKLEDYGGFDSFEEMLRRAQMQSYELHKAMFEGSIASRSHGLMMWMSNPAWPSLVWQSYDYYHDVNGGYYGLKTACQPVNLIWNRANNRMVLFNGTPRQEELTGVLRIYDLQGRLLRERKETAKVEKSSLKELFSVDFSEYASDIVFLKTWVYFADDGSTVDISITGNAKIAGDADITDNADIAGNTGDAGKADREEGRLAGENFYWHNHRSSRDFRTMSQLEYVHLQACMEEADGTWQQEAGWSGYSMELANLSEVPALQIRIKVLRQETGERVLPVFYEDNYFSLMPGERKRVRLEFRNSNLMGESPQFVVEGFNIHRQTVGIHQEGLICK